jgi:hypothetical protein
MTSTAGFVRYWSPVADPLLPHHGGWGQGSAGGTEPDSGHADTADNEKSKKSDNRFDCKVHMGTCTREKFMDFCFSFPDLEEHLFKRWVTGFDLLNFPSGFTNQPRAFVEFAHVLGLADIQTLFLPVGLGMTE